MFAGLNLFRVGATQKMGLKEFEFSQNYLMFWDKLERANYFFEAIIETADRAVDDRTVAFLLDGPLADGGQWNMFVNLVSKHGLVPKAFMPETESSSTLAPDERACCAASCARAPGSCATCTPHGASARRLARAASRSTWRSSTASSASTSARRRSASPGSGATRTATFHRDERDDAAGSSPTRTSTCRWTSTSAWCTTRAPTSPYGRTFTVSTWATWSAADRSST